MNKVLLLCVLFALSVCVFGKTQWFELENYGFDDYIKEYSKSYADEEYITRKQIFDNKLQAIKAHNQLQSSYKKGVNHLTDWSDAEIKVLFGYKKGSSSKHTARYMFPHEMPTLPATTLPTNVDWRNQGIVTPVKDQGECGSCWTFATAQTIESAYAQKTGHLAILSEQQILDCIPNPNDCGGTGGCGGGTADIAIAGLVSLGGLASEWTYPYISYWGDAFQCQFNSSKTKPVAVLKGITKLPPNDYNSVLSYLGTYGTLIINVAATGWHDYEVGVYTGCNNNTLDINHVVQLVGYGTDDKFGDYWLVRNSWTPSWGENGYIRLARTSVAECGIDHTPSDGTGCNGGPAEVTACGPCGLLYDTSYPVIA